MKLKTEPPECSPPPVYRKHKYLPYKTSNNYDVPAFRFFSSLQTNGLSTSNATLYVLAKIGCQDLCLKTITSENKVAIFKGPH